MKLVEIIPALQTSSEILARARAFAEACGKTITQSSDTPGFVSNRLLVPFINEGEYGVMMKDLSILATYNSDHFQIDSHHCPRDWCCDQRRH